MDYLTDVSAMEIIEQHYQKEQRLMRKKRGNGPSICEIIGAKNHEILHLEHRFRQRLVEKMVVKDKEE